VNDTWVAGGLARDLPLVTSTVTTTALLGRHLVAATVLMCTLAQTLRTRTD